MQLRVAELLCPPWGPVLLSSSIQASKIFQPRSRFVRVTASAVRLLPGAAVALQSAHLTRTARPPGVQRRLGQNYPPPPFSQNSYCLFCCMFLESLSSTLFCINKSVLNVIVTLFSTSFWLVLNKFPPGKLCFFFYILMSESTVLWTYFILFISRFWFFLKSMAQAKQQTQPDPKG